MLGKEVRIKFLAFGIDFVKVGMVRGGCKTVQCVNWHNLFYEVFHEVLQIWIDWNSEHKSMNAQHLCSVSKFAITAVANWPWTSAKPSQQGTYCWQTPNCLCCKWIAGVKCITSQQHFQSRACSFSTPSPGAEIVEIYPGDMTKQFFDHGSICNHPSPTVTSIQSTLPWKESI